MSPYSWTHVGTPSHLGHMDRVAATMPSQAHAGAAQEAPNIGQWEGQDVPLVRPSSCIVKGGIPSSRRYLPTYLGYAQLFEVVTGEKMDDIYTPTREWQDENLPEGPLTSAKFAKWMTSWSRKGKQVPGGVTMEAAKIQMMTELALYVTRNPDDRTMGKAYDRLWQAESESEFSHS